MTDFIDREALEAQAEQVYPSGRIANTIATKHFMAGVAASVAHLYANAQTEWSMRAVVNGTPVTVLGSFDYVNKMARNYPDATVTSRLVVKTDWSHIEEEQEK